MSDEVKSGFKTLIDRFISPISGTFLVSWMLINWRIVLIIFDGSFNAMEKPDLIVRLQEFNFWRLVLFPAVSTALYLFLMPIALYWFRLFTDWVECINYKQNKKHSIDLDVISQYQHTRTTLVELLFETIAKTNNDLDNLLISSNANFTQDQKNAIKRIHDNTNPMTELYAEIIHQRTGGFIPNLDWDFIKEKYGVMKLRIDKFKARFSK